MIGWLIQIVTIFTVAFLAEYVAYKIIKRIDKKSRSDIYKWELKNIEKIAEERRKRIDD